MRLYVDLRTLVPVKSHKDLLVSPGGIGFRMKNGEVVRCDWYQTEAGFDVDENGFATAAIRMSDFEPSTYIDEWKEIGLSESDVTPELLQSAVGFDEIYIEFFSCKDFKEIYLPYEITCIQLDNVDMTDRLTPEVRFSQVPEESGYFIYSDERGFFSRVIGKWNESMDGMLPMTKKQAERMLYGSQPDAQIVNIQAVSAKFLWQS